MTIDFDRLVDIAGVVGAVAAVVVIPATILAATSSTKAVRPVVTATCVILVFVIGGALLAATRFDDEPDHSSPTGTPSPSASEQSHHPDSTVAFAGWSPFGGVDAQFSEDRRSVRLDTHDTVATWTTKWSGIIADADSQCSMRLTGQVKDANHQFGNQGGFAVGLGTLSPTGTEVAGIAVQFDYAFEGYRTEPSSQIFTSAPDRRSPRLRGDQIMDSSKTVVERSIWSCGPIHRIPRRTGIVPAVPAATSVGAPEYGP